MPVKREVNLKSAHSSCRSVSLPMLSLSLSLSANTRVGLRLHLHTERIIHWTPDNQIYSCLIRDRHFVQVFDLRPTGVSTLKRKSRCSFSPYLTTLANISGYA